MYATVDTTVVAFDATTCRKRWTYKWNATGHAISPTNRGVAIKTEFWCAARQTAT